MTGITNAMNKPGNSVTGFMPTAYNADGLITKGEWYGDTIPEQFFSQQMEFSKLTEVTAESAKSTGFYAFDHCPSLTTVIFPKATTISPRAFYYCENLTSVIAPKINVIGFSAFEGCRKLTLTAEPFPYVFNIEPEAFADCESLTTVNFNEVSTVESDAFTRCYSLAVAEFRGLGELDGRAFNSCYGLNALIIRNLYSVCRLVGDASSFYSTPIGEGTGYIYVPEHLVEDYKSAENWSEFASQIRNMDDYWNQ